MLETIMFYLFAWWFVKLENKTATLVRALLAGGLSVFFLVGMICLLTDEIMTKNGDNLMGLIFLPFIILLTIRTICDIVKIRNLPKK